MCVVPGQLAIAAFSPRLDPFGNSVRAQAAITGIANDLQLNLYLGAGQRTGAQPHLVNSHESVPAHASA
jgi:hypothetical protein